MFHRQHRADLIIFGYKFVVFELFDRFLAQNRAVNLTHSINSVGPEIAAPERMWHNAHQIRQQKELVDD